MKDRYKEILDGLSEDTAPKHKDDRILIIDGLNTFIRSFAVNPSTNEDGIHVGGMTGFLHSIGFAIRNTCKNLICVKNIGLNTKKLLWHSRPSAMKFNKHFVQQDKMLMNFEIIRWCSVLQQKTLDMRNLIYFSKQ